MTLEPSILISTKQALGIEPDDTSFDQEILIFINGAFSTLEQLGVGPDVGFQIADDSANWTEFVTDIRMLNSVKPYVYLIVRTKFDPPTTAYLVTAMQDQIKELEVRLNTRAEHLIWRDPNPPEVNPDE